MVIEKRKCQMSSAVTGCLNNQRQTHSFVCEVHIRLSISITLCMCVFMSIYGAQWLRGRASNFRLRKPVFESCAVVLKPWARFFTLYCSSSLGCINEAIDSGGYVYGQPSRINCSIWLDSSQRSRDGV